MSLPFSIEANEHGHRIIYINEQWVYADNRKPINRKRACTRCGKTPTKEGHDTCLGHIKGVYSACCGHGVIEPFLMYKEFGEVKDLIGVWLK